MNKISEKYFGKHTFHPDIKKITAQTIDETGFKIKKEIWRGIIYDKNKVGSLIYSGEYNAKPAILKIQGLKPEIDEIDIFNLFKKNNLSAKIKLPELFAKKKYSRKTGFGYLIMENIPQKKIFAPPFASEKQIKLFCEFYNEYREKVFAVPWWKNSINTEKFILQRLAGWIKISKHKKFWDENLQGIRVKQFRKIIKANSDKIPMVFSRGHLSCNDLYLQKNKFVLLSNLFWSWRPKYYDLAFNLWACLLKLPADYSFEKTILFLEKWITAYRSIPWIKKQKDFDEIFYILLLERLLGSLVIDVRAGNQPKSEQKKLFELHLKLFDYFAKLIQG
ncbi:hypothetical protein KKC32_02875 [Patescibacteria group bacterium]|nr:hypothetical protein [Patescibacteria group bacterium]